MRGFTLVELLVTMAIISILTALLMPVVIATRTKVYAHVSGGGLRQVGMACSLYRTDHDGYFPIPHWAGPGDASDANGDGVAEWYEKLIPYVDTVRVFRVTVDESDAALRPCSFADNSWFDYRVNESIVVDPSDTIYATEREDWYPHDFIEWWHWQEGVWPPDPARVPTEAARPQVDIERYNGFVNYLYVDGHVKQKRFADTWSPRVSWWPEAPVDVPEGPRL